MIKNSQKGLPTFNQNLLCVSGIIIIEKKCTVFSVTFTNMHLYAIDLHLYVLSVTWKYIVNAVLCFERGQFVRDFVWGGGC